MSTVGNRELDDLTREIAAFRLLIQNQEILLEVLERDGHDVSDQEAALRKSRSELALQISRQSHLVQMSMKTLNNERPSCDVPQP